MNSLLAAVVTALVVQGGFVPGRATPEQRAKLREMGLQRAAEWRADLAQDPIIAADAAVARGDLRLNAIMPWGGVFGTNLSTDTLGRCSVRWVDSDFILQEAMPLRPLAVRWWGAYNRRVLAVSGCAPGWSAQPDG